MKFIKFIFFTLVLSGCSTTNKLVKDVETICLPGQVATFEAREGYLKFSCYQPNRRKIPSKDIHTASI